MRNYATTETRIHPSQAAQALYAQAEQAARAEHEARVAGIVRIERGPGAYRVTFPKLAAAERGTPEARAAWDEARRPMQDVKAIMGRRFDSMQGAWIVPLSQPSAIECLSLDYAAPIEDAAVDSDAAARIAELERQLAELSAAYTDALQHDCRAIVAVQS